MKRLTPWMLAMAGSALVFGPRARAQELRPDQVLVVANKYMPHSVDLARYYMKRRAIPPENLVKLDTTDSETIAREDYEKEIASPVRKFLTKNDPDGKKFACIVLMYGIPLRVQPPELSGKEQAHLDGLRKARSDLEQKTRLLEKSSPEEAKRARDEASKLDQQIRRADKSNCVASVDSEIALVMEKPYPLDGWLLSRFFLDFRGREDAKMPQRVLLTSRLDGPTEAIVRRIIDDSLETEERGLSGTAYFDAQYPDKGEKSTSFSAAYDRAIHDAARVVEKSGRMKVVLDEKGKLFQPGEAPNAALYCGWYSYGRYVDAFTWARGAVGFHVASAECTTLKDKASTVWCKVMLEKGVAATLGPVTEPYLQAFPRPEVFFSCLVNGFALGQCYAISNPFWSWQMVLIGDPLYRPFKIGSGAQRQ